MQRPPDTSKLSKLPFVVGNLVLLLTAWVIFGQAGRPLQAAPLIVITVCVAFAAMCLFIPFLLDYTREQDAALVERQRALEALARTTAETAEQIGIAAAGLHTITELAQKNLKAAEILPQKLQEKTDEFNQRLAAAHTSAAKMLRQEINAHLTAEVEKLEAAAGKIASATAGLASLEPARRPPRAAAPDKTPAKDETPTVTEASSRAAEASPAAARPSGSGPLEPVAGPIAAEVAAPQPAVNPPENPVPDGGISPAVAAAIAAADALVMETAPEELHTISPFPFVARPPSAATPAAPKRGKRAKSTAIAPGITPPVSPPAEITPPEKESIHDTNNLFDLGINDDTPLSPSASFINEAFPTPPPFAFARKAPEPESRAAPVGESALSSDGVTRLVVTAYIGIGNKLFIRGDGPGLSLDKGVPLSFVSIGKWRWETADATAPVTIRLYKNDQQECTALGPVALQPGRQHEVTADF